jgi:GTP-binding protein
MRIVDASFVMSAPDVQWCPPADMPEYVFIGRSNVGKSSLINALCNKKEFARTSSEPGKTLLINYFAIDSVDDEGNHKQRHLVDLPGYGYARASKQDRHDLQDMILDYIEHRTAIGMICVLIDSRHAPQAIDIAFINQLAERDKPYCIVFTKSDQCKPRDLHAHTRAFLDEIGKTRQDLPTHFITSASKKTGIGDLISALHDLHSE